MLGHSQLPSQVEFICLSVPNLLLPSGLLPHPVLHDAALKTDKVTALTPYVPVNHISHEAYTWLAAAEARAAHRGVTENLGEPMELVLPSTPSTYEPERILPNSAPPKRFFRTFWRSITLRMLDREFNAAMMKE
jgi:hypothetical protein